MSRRRKPATPDESELRVVRRGDWLVLRLHESEVQVLQWVFADLERVLDEGAPANPVRERLFPRAYLDPTEEAAESEWQSSAHGELVEIRLTALRSVELALASATPGSGREPMQEVTLDDAQAEQWLGILNDARLALGTALGVTADADFDALEADDPRRETALVYDWLTHLLAALLGAGSDPETGTDDD